MKRPPPHSPHLPSSVLLVHGRSERRPRTRRLERRRKAEDVGLAKQPGDNLQADRQAVLRQAARHRSSRQSAKIEGIGVGNPGNDIATLKASRHVAGDVKRGRRRRRSEERIVALKEDSDLLAELVALEYARVIVLEALVERRS